MHTPTRTARCACILLAALLAGCARRPSREIDEAKRRLVEAEAAQAPIYAPSSFEEARRALHEAERLAAQRKYGDARIVALESAARSRSAVGLTAENRKKMLEALRVNIEATQRQLADAEQEISVAVAQHVDAKQIDMFRRDLAGARAKLDSARRSHAAGDLPGGRKGSEDARIAADMVLREIRFAIAQNPISHPAPRKSRRRP
ncbi:MAG TPA: hypothetical protein VKH46_03265 [Thermoanaerobaculia bacterium]|jgi:hypothetical protein|nr:hypothetical protein [Thermoanaerobaculia bacterium]